MGESEAPSLFQKEKRRSAQSDVSKVLFPDIGKITHPSNVTNVSNSSQNRIYLYIAISFICVYFYFVFSWFSLKHILGYSQSQRQWEIIHIAAYLTQRKLAS